MPNNPKEAFEKIEEIINAWETLAPTESFGEMTLAEFKAHTQPSFDIRNTIKDLNNRLTGAQSDRDDADKVSLAKVKVVVNGVKGDIKFGPNSKLYEAMGYVRESEQKSGLSRKDNKKNDKKE